MKTSHSTPPGEARLREPPRHAPELSRRRRLSWQAGGLAALAAFSMVVIMILNSGSPALLATSFPKAEKLISNERAYFSPKAPGVHLSPDWMVTSGSLFSDNG